MACDLKFTYSCIDIHFKPKPSLNQTLSGPLKCPVYKGFTVLGDQWLFSQQCITWWPYYSSLKINSFAFIFLFQLLIHCVNILRKKTTFQQSWEVYSWILFQRAARGSRMFSNTADILTEVMHLNSTGGSTCYWRICCNEWCIANYLR